MLMLITTTPPSLSFFFSSFTLSLLIYTCSCVTWHSYILLITNAVIIFHLFLKHTYFDNTYRICWKVSSSTLTNHKSASSMINILSTSLLVNMTRNLPLNSQFVSTFWNLLKLQVMRISLISNMPISMYAVCPKMNGPSPLNIWVAVTNKCHIANHCQLWVVF